MRPWRLSDIAAVATHANNPRIGRNLRDGFPYPYTPDDARAFIEQYADRMGYMHLKTSSPEHKVQQVIADNELDFDIIFAIASKAKMPYVGFELDQPATLEQAIENHKKSVEYLMGKFGG